MAIATTSKAAKPKYAKPAAVPVEISGHGLVTGLPVTVSIACGTPGTGVVFVLPENIELRAHFSSVVNTDRGVTLGVMGPDGQPVATLSIVEHFLAAVSLAGLSDLRVTVTGAPELPILDGSSGPWYDLLIAHFCRSGYPKIKPDVPLRDAVLYRHDEATCLYALPSETFQLTYAVDFEHADLRHRSVHWDALVEGPEALVSAGTFGYVHELPALQARGLAKGVTTENTLGLSLDEAGYTRPLRLPDEPIRHKMLDLLGDLTLAGINPLRLKAHIFAIGAGHKSHIAFAKRLLQALGPV